GGIAGFNLNTDAIGGYTGLIINSYNAGNITATSDNASSAYAGGITGYNRYVSDNSYGEVKWSYSSGIISASNIYAGGQSYAGGVVGWNETSIKLIESYYLNTSATQVTFNESGINCSSKTSAEIKSYDFASLLNNKNYVGATIWSSVDLNTNAKLTWELNY
ncbi:MAG: hypothetical protein PHC46_00665, partial [Clostridia bacterium]|nr:hypothetical protein [Clostridia bacterium]